MLTYYKTDVGRREAWRTIGLLGNLWLYLRRIWVVLATIQPQTTRSTSVDGVVCMHVVPEHVKPAADSTSKCILTQLRSYRLVTVGRWLRPAQFMCQLKEQSRLSRRSQQIFFWDITQSHLLALQFHIEGLVTFLSPSGWKFL